MGFALEKDLMELSIEEDKPWNLKNNPKFSSVERNTCSLMGRLLNPEVQKMSNMIHDIPRLWRCYDRVHGYALSRTAFNLSLISRLTCRMFLMRVHGLMKIGV